MEHISIQINGKSNLEIDKKVEFFIFANNMQSYTHTDAHSIINHLTGIISRTFTFYCKQHLSVRCSWDAYFIEISETVASRATCDRGRSGCVVTRDNQILVTGYVGSPKGLPHCDDVGHQLKQVKHTDSDGTITTHCVRTIHAEQNAICQAAKNGISLKGATLYCKMTPCRVCAMLIINCGIVRVVCASKYHAGQESEQLFAQAGVDISFISTEVQKYENQ